MTCELNEGLCDPGGCIDQTETEGVDCDCTGVPPLSNSLSACGTPPSCE